MLKIAVLAPIPRPRVRTAMAVKPRFLRSMRKPKRISCRVVSITRTRRVSRHFSWSARCRPGRVARDGTPLLASSLARRIPRFFVRGGRATRRPIPGPPAPGETTTAAVAESCSQMLRSHLQPPFRAARRSRLFKLNNPRNGARKPAPVICFFFELSPPEPCERIVFRPPAILGCFPLGCNPALLFQLVQSRVERSVAHLQHVARHLL
jgi:hypothetical protein